MQPFKNLRVWEKAHELTLEVYRVSAVFPRAELFGLTSQMRRSSVSIGANIAEGRGRGSDLDFARFLQVAMGSACELEYHLLLTRDLGYLEPEDFDRLDSLTSEVKRMLTSFMQRLKSQSENTNVD